MLQLVADRELARRDLVLLAERLQRLDRLVVRVDVGGEGDVRLASVRDGRQRSTTHLGVLVAVVDDGVLG